MLAEVAGGRVGEGERVVLATHLLGADAHGGVGAEAEAHLAAVVEREGARRAGAEQRQEHRPDRSRSAAEAPGLRKGRRHAPALTRVLRDLSRNFGRSGPFAAASGPRGGPASPWPSAHPRDTEGHPEPRTGENQPGRVEPKAEQ